MNDRMPILIILTLVGAVVLFHLSILFKLLPYTIIGGGRLKNASDMVVVETSAIVINLFFVLLLMMKAKFIKIRFSEKITNLLLWLFLVFFLLNTIANLLAKTTFEKTFAILTLAFTVMLWKILKKKKTSA